MKNIQNYNAAKYIKTGFSSLFKKSDYKKIEDGIYEYKKGNETLYVTSLSFVQEPEFEEGDSAADISQYPLEDILDKFYCHISDFYDDLNVAESKTCYLEFAAMSLEDIKKLRSIIGKHVYNQEYEKDGRTYVKLVIDPKADNKISLTQLIDEPYEQKYFNECKFIWKNYVPKNGQATSLQGELLRELEKLRCEAQDNGNINWDNDFAYFCDFIAKTICMQTIYSDDEKEKYNLILSYFKECGEYAAKFHNGQLSDNDLEVKKTAYVQDNLYDIIADAIGQLNLHYSSPISYEINHEIKR